MLLHLLTKDSSHQLPFLIRSSVTWAKGKRKMKSNYWDINSLIHPHHLKCEKWLILPIKEWRRDYTASLAALKGFSFGCVCATKIFCSREKNYPNSLCNPLLCYLLGVGTHFCCRKENKCSPTSKLHIDFIESSLWGSLRCFLVSGVGLRVNKKKWDPSDHISPWFNSFWV